MQDLLITEKVQLSDTHLYEWLQGDCDCKHQALQHIQYLIGTCLALVMPVNLSILLLHMPFVYDKVSWSRCVSFSDYQDIITL